MKQLLGPIYLCIALWIFFPPGLSAEPLGLGFPEYQREVSLLRSEDALPRVLRRAISGHLIGEEGKNLHGSQALSDAMTVSSDYQRWSFRIKPLAKFSNREIVSAPDVSYSLKRCGDEGLIPGVASVGILSGLKAPEESWVELVISNPSPERAREVRRGVAMCPIIERNSSILFGDYLGLGSNVVSSGSYAISAVTPGRKYILDRVRRTTADRAGVDQLELRVFSQPEQALAALRVGTIGAFVSTDEATINRAKVDETLRIEDCQGYRVIRRDGVTMPCIEELSVLELRK